MGGSGRGVTDKPDAFLAAGIEETGDLFQPGPVDPGLHLSDRGTPGGKNDPSLIPGPPAGLDPGEGVLVGIGIDTEFDSTGWKAGPVSMHRRLQPTSGRKVVILGKNPPRPPKTGISGRQVGAEKEPIAPLHPAGKTAEEGKRIEVGENTEKGEQAWPRENGDGGREMGGQINPAGNLVFSGEASGCTTSQGEIGIGSEEEGRLREPLEKQGLLGSLRATQGDQGIARGRFFAKEGCGTLVEPADRRAFPERRAGEMDFFP